MKWEEIKAKYPSKWVVIEALEAHDFGDKRVIDESSVVNVFDESMAAFREYRTLHKLNPDREFLFCKHDHRSASNTDTSMGWFKAMTDLLIDTGIPFTSISLVNKGSTIKIEKVLVDTGSAATIFSADFLERFGLIPDHNDSIHRMSGIGGYEYVVQKRVDGLQLGDMLIENIDIQLGDMDYGFAINGILGFDVLSKMGAIIIGVR